MCGRTATMSCAFCPTAFCSEHHHNNIRLTEYYQLACLKHNEVVLCEDPRVLKIFGLTKTAKPSSSRKTPHRRSGDGVRRIRTGESEDGKSGLVSKNRSDRHKRKPADPVPEPRERGPKRSCRDRLEVKKTELERDSSPRDVSARLGKSTDDDVKRHSKKKERRPSDKLHERRESDTERKRSHSSDNKKARLGTAEGSEHSEKSRITNDTLANVDHRQRLIRKDDADTERSKKSRKKSESLFSDGGKRRTCKQDLDQSAYKRREIQDSESTDKSPTAGLSFLSATKGRSLSPSVPSKLSSTTASVDTRLTAKSAVSSSVTAAKSLVDEPLFDNSDDEFPELVIDVPTI